MTKRHVDIDDEMLERVQTYYGTKSIREAVNLALNEVIKTIVQHKAIDYWIAEQKLRDFEEMEREMMQELDTLSTRAHSYERTCGPLTTNSSDCLIEEGSPPAP